MWLIILISGDRLAILSQEPRQQHNKGREVILDTHSTIWTMLRKAADIIQQECIQSRMTNIRRSFQPRVFAPLPLQHLQ